MSKLLLITGLIAFNLLALAEAKAAAPECRLVTTRQVDVGFVNGVNVSEKQAKDNAKKLSISTHRPVTLFYNHTEGLTLDLLEAFDQRMAEMPLSLRDHYELYHEFLVGGGALSRSELANGTPWRGKQVDLLSVSVSGIMQAVRVFAGDKLRFYAKAMQRPITNFDYAEHNRQLHLMVKDSDRVVLVAHSQGNLFANHAFEQLTIAEQKKVGVVHVAPASVRLYGGYVLADKDEVIADLKYTGTSRMPTTSIPPFEQRPAPGDSKGHSFIEIYLNEGMTPYPQVMRLIQAEIDKVPVPGLYGTYRSAATWHNARHITWSGTSVLSGDHGTWKNETYRCSGIFVRDKDNAWHILTLQGNCAKESIGISEEILQRNGSVYQVSGVSRDLATGQTWGGVSRCMGDYLVKHNQRHQPSLKERWSIP